MLFAYILLVHIVCLVLSYPVKSYLVKSYSKISYLIRSRPLLQDDFKRNGIEGTPPPFYYGTHYSCAGYVLHYLLR